MRANQFAFVHENQNKLAPISAKYRLKRPESGVPKGGIAFVIDVWL